MIGVLADDFSGASEIAGLAVWAGLSAHVWTTYGSDLELAEFLRGDGPLRLPDLLVIDTDTRSLPPAAAAERVARQTVLLRAAGVRRFYKKIDSVLRGQVAAEITAMVEAGGFSRALLLPANPSRGRVIVGGRYFVGGVPLHQTVFKDDPEHPALTAVLAERLADAADRLTILPDPADPLPDQGILVAEAASSTAVEAWAARVDDTTLAVGAAEFFSAWLRRHLESPRRAVPVEADVGLSNQVSPCRDLFVCGSAAAWSHGRASDCQTQRIPVVALQPAAPGGPPIADTASAASEPIALREELARHGRAMLAIGDAPSHHPEVPPRVWVELLASHVAALLASLNSAQPHGGVERIFVEGGMTAAALARRLGWNRFVAHPPLAPGITPLSRYGHEYPQLIPKPGSYAWPFTAMNRSSFDRA